MKTPVKLSLTENPVLTAKTPNVRRSVAVSTAIVSSATAVSAVLGFGREIVTAHYYGTHSDLDAFLNASTIPLVLFGVFNGSLTGALVPTFSEYVSHGGETELRRLASTILNVIFALVASLAIVGYIVAPWIVMLVAHGFPGPKQALEVQMVRLLMPSIIATTLSGICGALLNANHRFLAPALNSVAQNIVTIALIIILERYVGIFAIVYGTLLGIVAALLVQLPLVFKLRLYQLVLDLRHPGLAKALALFIPVAIGAGAWQVNLAADRYFASTLNAGSTAALSYATRVAFLPILIVAGAIATVIFPLISGHFANNDRAAIRRSVSRSLGIVGFIVLPCAGVLIALSYPIVQTLFERGAFGRESTKYCSALIPFACVPLIAISYNTVMVRAAYACKQMRLSVISSFLVVGLNIVLSACFLRVLGARGLLLANGLAMFFGTAFLYVLLWRIAGGLDWKPLCSSLLRVTIAVTAMIVAASYLVRAIHLELHQTELSRFANLIIVLVASGLLYLGIARCLRIPELNTVFGALGAKLSRFRSNRTAAIT